MRAFLVTFSVIAFFSDPHVALGSGRNSSSDKRFAAEDEATQREIYPIRHPPPEYPEWCRQRLVGGSGVFRLVVDYERGAVTKVVTLKGTGSEKLDAAGFKAFLKWRFAPRTTRAVKVPLTFTIDDWNSWETDELQRARKHATFSPTPSFPTRARFDWVRGWGIFQFIVNYETGRVTSVNVLRTTGSGLLDNSIVHTFRIWRFQPHTIRTLTTRFGFMFGRKDLGNT